MCDFSGVQNGSRLSARMVWAPCWEWTSLAKCTVWASHLSWVAISSKSRMLCMEKGKLLRHGGSCEVLEYVCRMSWVSLRSVVKKPGRTSLARVGTRAGSGICVHSTVCLDRSVGQHVDDVEPPASPTPKHKSGNQFWAKDSEKQWVPPLLYKLVGSAKKRQPHRKKKV